MLLDFGLAKMLGAATLTLTGSFQGSPVYASPEQISPDRGEVGPASDVYSLGVTLYEAVTGRVPFDGETTAQVFRSILEGDPPRVRARSGSLPPDLETVIEKAMDRDARDRYATVGEFADDLDAILNLDPIRARPIGRLTRMRRWMARNKTTTAAIAVGLLALASVPVLLGLESARAERARSEVAADALRGAAAILAECVRDMPSPSESVERVDQARSMFSQHHSLASWAEFDRETEAEAATRTAQTVGFREALRMIDRAEDAGASVAAVRQARAQVYFQRWRVAKARRHEAGAMEYAELIRSHDTTGKLVAALDKRWRVDLRCQPEARMWVLRYQKVVREPRLAPAPLGGTPTVDPGTWGLRIVRATGAIEPMDTIVRLAGCAVEGAVFALRDRGRVRAGDRLVSIDGEAVRSMFDVEQVTWPKPEAPKAARRFVFERAGTGVRVGTTAHGGLGDARALAEQGGVPATVYREGSLVQVNLSEGLVTRMTAAPLLLNEESCVVDSVSLAEGDYLIVGYRPGFEPYRVRIRVGPGLWQDFTVKLDPVGTTPTGMVRIGPALVAMEREVTAGEYLEFLNDPETVAFVDRAGRPVRFPRTVDTALVGGLWVRRDGEFHLPEDWHPDMPVLGVSWQDCTAYAKWRTERQPGGAARWIYRLPELEHYMVMASQHDFGRRFAYGNVFRPLWSKSCNSRPYACVERVMQFPIDESPLGIFDLTGSASEWTATPWNFGTQRGMIEGNWGQAQELRFGAANGVGDDAVMETFGFRLIAEPAEPSAGK